MLGAGAAAVGAVRTMRPVGVSRVLVVCRQDFDLPGRTFPGRRRSWVSTSSGCCGVVCCPVRLLRSF